MIDANADPHLAAARSVPRWIPELAEREGDDEIGYSLMHACCARPSLATEANRHRTCARLFEQADELLRRIRQREVKSVAVAIRGVESRHQRIRACAERREAATVEGVRHMLRSVGEAARHPSVFVAHDWHPERGVAEVLYTFRVEGRGRSRDDAVQDAQCRMLDVATWAASHAESDELRLPTTMQPAIEVRWSRRDRCFVGRCPGVLEGEVRGDDAGAVRREVEARLKASGGRRTKPRAR